MSFLISKDEQQLGPFTVEEINVQLEGGMLDPADLCWTEGFDDWYELNQVEEFVMPGTKAVPETQVETELLTPAATDAESTEDGPALMATGAVASRFGWRKKWFIGGGIAAVLMAIGAFLVFGGAGLAGLCQEFAEPHPEPALPQDLEAKMLRVRAKVERLVADGNETEAKDRLDQLLKAAP